MTELPDINALSLADIKHLLLAVLADNADLKRRLESALSRVAAPEAKNAALTGEIVRFGGLKSKPDIKPPAKPSGMERAKFFGDQHHPHPRFGRVTGLSPCAPPLQSPRTMLGASCTALS